MTTLEILGKLARESSEAWKLAKQSADSDRRPLFVAAAPAKQLPMLRGLDCSPGQLDLFDDMEVC